MFNGIYTPIVTPFDEDEALRMFDRIMDYFTEAGG